MTKQLHGFRHTKFYTVWLNMKNRCSNHNCVQFKDYGKRGIKVCDEWKNFINFKEDMYDDYLYHQEKFGEKDTSIDRIDNDGNYCKENCKWATRKEQCNNQRYKVRLYEKKEEMKKLREMGLTTSKISKIYNCSQAVVSWITIGSNYYKKFD